ncbi:MAG TPA: hypothetical protein VGE35_04040 [Candidatus Paceibacterota bacterium]
MPITFRVRKHDHKPGIEIVEILMDGKTVACIYPEDDGRGIKVVSAHLKGSGTPGDNFQKHVKLLDNSGTMMPIPSIQMVFEPGRYVVSGGLMRRVNPSSN